MSAPLRGLALAAALLAASPALAAKKAQALVARRQRSPFRKPEDVLQVKGFGPGWLQKAKGNITVAGAPTAGASAVASETPRR